MTLHRPRPLPRPGGQRSCAVGLLRVSAEERHLGNVGAGQLAAPRQKSASPRFFAHGPSAERRHPGLCGFVAAGLGHPSAAPLRGGGPPGTGEHSQSMRATPEVRKRRPCKARVRDSRARPPARLRRGEPEAGGRHSNRDSKLRNGQHSGSQTHRDAVIQRRACAA